MIVRTYGRRGRSSSGSLARSSFGEEFEDSLLSSQEPNSQEDLFSFAFPSQDSTRNHHQWSFDSDPYSFDSSPESRQLAIKPARVRDSDNFDGGFRKSKKSRTSKNNSRVKSLFTETTTLMETQEFGEMVEHEDEVNFALDGLRKGQPVRIRRASLLSLLTICGSAQQRRLLRTHGMAKTIIQAVLGLSFDDTPSNLAAAALFYILTNDGQEDQLLDSSSSIRFLLKLLKPLASNATQDKVSTIGSKLLALHKDFSIFQDRKGLDTTSGAILLKVQDILVNCKEMKPTDEDNTVSEKPQLTPKWLALLTMEKACLSTISLEETTGTVRKSGGNFKERLRVHGGLDAVFEIIRNCHTTVEGWLEQHSSSTLGSHDIVNLDNMVVLLKCLKIMENATLLSNENQSHLLGIEEDFSYQQSSQSFTKLILSVIKILSGITLVVNSSGSSAQESCYNISDGTIPLSEMPSVAENKVDCNDIVILSSSTEGSSMEWFSSQKSSCVSDKGQKMPIGRSCFSEPNSQTTVDDTHVLNMRVKSSASGSCSGASNSSNKGPHVSTKGSWIKLDLGRKSKFREDVKSESLESSEDPFAFDEGDNGLWMKPGHAKKSGFSEDMKFEHLEDGEDPFAFVEDEFAPSKWDLLSGKQNPSQPKKNSGMDREEDEYRSQSLMVSSQQESCNMEKHPCSQVSCPPAVVDEETSNLLADCLLTAVKVLMNLTNDNSVGCQQIAACGGLEILSSLIAGHFPSFNAYLPTFSELRDKSILKGDSQNNQRLTDQELDLLVAILGLLVNLVEKDGRNRLRLASASISIPNSKGKDNGIADAIPLLCSIFLANQGAGEAAEEGRQSDWDEEDPILQGEKEAEKMIVEAYSALLLAFISTESKSIHNAIAECLPGHKLAILVPVMERFLEFHLALNMISPETHTRVLEVIESCRLP